MRQENYLSGSCHIAWRLSLCPKAPLGCHAASITPVPRLLWGIMLQASPLPQQPQLPTVLVRSCAEAEQQRNVTTTNGLISCQAAPKAPDRSHKCPQDVGLAQT